MAKIIDTRNSDGVLAVLGDYITIPTSTSEFTAVPGSMRYNNISTSVEFYLPTTGNQYAWTSQTAPNQFSFTGDDYNGMIALPRSPNGIPLYIQYGRITGSATGAYSPFPFPFPNGCTVVTSSDTGPAVWAFAFINITRFGCTVLCDHSYPGTSGYTAQIIAIGW